MNSFAPSLKIIESFACVEDGTPYEVRRGWKERLLSRPWQPFMKTRTVIPKVPMQGGYLLGSHSVVMHPMIAKQFK